MFNNLKTTAIVLAGLLMSNGLLAETSDKAVASTATARGQASGTAKNFGANSFSIYCVYRLNGAYILYCNYPGVTANSRVSVSISEYNTTPDTRFIGSATFSTTNVAPYNGGVAVRANIAWGSPLNTRLDILVDN